MNPEGTEQCISGYYLVQNWRLRRPADTEAYGATLHHQYNGLPLIYLPAMCTGDERLLALLAPIHYHTLTLALKSDSIHLHLHVTQISVKA